ncbi:MAG: hypothetical protein GY805_06980 [Chloroflexi bacterium]|nr:hypothetical protein [Chloroflexota bacterium]
MTDSHLKLSLFALLTLTALLLSIAFVVVKRPLGILAVLIIAGGWGILLWQEKYQAAVWPMLLLTLAAALVHLPLNLVNTAPAVSTASAVSTAPAVVWSYLSVIGALLLWDLSRFQQRLQDSEAAHSLIIAHLNRLGLLVMLALVALALQQWLPLSFNFDWALLGGLALLFGLTFLLRSFKDTL